MVKGPNRSILQYVNGGTVSIRSVGKSAIFCVANLPRNILRFTQFQMKPLTTESMLMIQ